MFTRVAFVSSFDGRSNAVKLVRSSKWENCSNTIDDIYRVGLNYSRLGISPGRYSQMESFVEIGRPIIRFRFGSLLSFLVCQMGPD